VRVDPVDFPCARRHALIDDYRRAAAILHELSATGIALLA
jgi:hypothetical protein